MIGGPSLSTSYLGTFLVFLYIWLPFMVLPIVAALERVPRSLRRGLGRPRGHARHRPSAGSSCRSPCRAWSPARSSRSRSRWATTSSPGIIGGSQPFIGQAVYQHQGTAGNIPLAAALTVVPIAIMAVYLTVARRLGAFEAL